LLDKVAEMKPIAISTGYHLALKGLDQGTKRDTADQGVYFEVTIDFEKNINLYIEREWWSQVPRGTEGMVCSVMEAAPTDGMSKTCRPVAVPYAANDGSCPVSNSQVSVLEAVTMLRGMLRPGMEVVTSDLSKFFYHIRARFVDPEGVQQNLLLQTHEGLYNSDRLVFGLLCGPLAGTCAMQVLKCVASVVAQVKHGCDSKRALISDVIDDFNFF